MLKRIYIKVKKKVFNTLPNGNLTENMYCIDVDITLTGNSRTICNNRDCKFEVEAVIPKKVKSVSGITKSFLSIQYIANRKFKYEEVLQTKFISVSDVHIETIHDICKGFIERIVTP